MENTRPILYGVADYAQIRKKNGWFIDRTAKIRDLEATAYAMFLRPRRFGKSLFVSLLEYYYDLKFKDRFDELFGSTAIGAAPTEEHSGYLILKFDFSAVSKDIHAVENDFNAYTGLCCDAFARRYAGLIPEGLSDRILSASGVSAKLNEIFLGMRECAHRLYVVIDENLCTDYAKIRHLVTADRRLNGNFHVLENLIAGGNLTERRSRRSSPRPRNSSTSIPPPVISLRNGTLAAAFRCIE